MADMEASKDIAVHIDIPTPEVHRIRIVHRAAMQTRIPSGYVPFHKTEYPPNEYDATEEDAEFVKTLTPPISLDLFEEIFTKIELLSFERVCALTILFSSHRISLSGTLTPPHLIATRYRANVAPTSRDAD